MTRLSRDDSGQITTALVMVGIVAVVSLGLVVIKLGQATDEKSHFQSAADAAALAGAQRIRTQIPGLVPAAVGGPGRPFFVSNTCGMGQDAATAFAVRLGAEVTEYCYDPKSDTVEVTLASLSNSAVASPSAKVSASARARVGLVLDACDVPVPSPTQTPTPDILCGELSFHVGMTDLDILDQFTPALKS